MGRSRVPVVVSLCTVALNLAANVVLVRVMGFRGLALGTSLAMLVNGLALLVLLRRRLGGLEDGHLGLTFAKIVVAALVMAAVSAGVEQILAGAIPGSGTLTQALRLGAAITAGLVGLAGTAKLLHIREFDSAVAGVRSRLM